MTDPGDKTRELLHSLRTLAFVECGDTHTYLCHDCAPPVVAQAIREARREALEDACLAACDLCCSSAWKPAEFDQLCANMRHAPEPSSGNLYCGHPMLCHAQKIRALIAREEKP